MCNRLANERRVNHNEGSDVTAPQVQGRVVVTLNQQPSPPLGLWRVPDPGKQVTVRGHNWVVTDVQASTITPPNVSPGNYDPTHLVTLKCLDDDRWEHEIQVLWEIEPGRRIFERFNLPTPDPDNLDDPEQLEAFLDAVRWGAVTNADKEALQAPFRSGITIEDYQLEPLVRALRMPRVNLLIADDVGLGKTIEAGLVAQELILRHRVHTALILCPAPLQLKWKAEMYEKFGLNFEIINTEFVNNLRRSRGIRASPFTAYPRMIASLDWIKRERPMRMLRQVLPSVPAYPRKFDLLIIDEVHNVAPAAVGKYATDSQRTEAVRELAPNFEHRLYLSATPHNGYVESWTALLELLDPQRFARGVKPDDDVRDQVVIRRLKSQFIADDAETSRFPRRTIQELPVRYCDEERQAHADLKAYAQMRAAAKGRKDSPGEFIHKLLKKRLFSSPEAFHRTLLKHIETAERGGVQETAPPERTVLRSIGAVDDEFATEEEAEQAEQTALELSGRATEPLTDEQRQLLKRLESWAQVAAGRADAKTEVLIEWLESVVKTDGEWNDERVLIFTEYRDTQRYLIDQLTAAGLARDAGRVRQMHGSQDEDEREEIKAAFQASPDLDPVRIIIATDTASEGIDLQRNCHRLVHFEIPWNPNRLEQRNGRIDRHGQPNPTADVFHFVGEGFENAEPGSYEADLEFLYRAAWKVEQIREDLGSAGAVIADQVAEAMLGQRPALDENKIDAQVAIRHLAQTEMKLREKIAEWTAAVDDTRESMGLTPDRVERAVSVALALDNQPPLQPHRVERSNTEAHDVFNVPSLDRGWARTKQHGLRHAVTKAELPVTFDHDVAAGQDDVALLHLGHPIVQKSLQTLRAEIWIDDNPKLSRVSTAVVPDSLLPDVDGAILAHGRLVITGRTGSRLHEALIVSGGRVSRGLWDQLAVADIDPLVDALEGRQVPLVAVRKITAHWGLLEERVLGSLDRRSSDIGNGLRRTFETRANDAADSIAKILNELAATIESRLESPDFEQLKLDLEDKGSNEERQQLRFDEEKLRARLEQIPDEIERESAAVRERYEDPKVRMFPAALTIVVPERLASS